MSTLRTMVIREARELTEAEVSAISVIERACSVLSLLGCIFTIVTFCCSRGFHKPINRLVFYASFGNMMTNVGTLMSRAYLPELGFWNAVTSWGACRDLLHDLRQLLTPARGAPRPLSAPCQGPSCRTSVPPPPPPSRDAGGAAPAPEPPARQFLRSSPPRSLTRTLSSESTMELAKTHTYSADGSQSC